MIRALIAQSFEPTLKILGESSSEDVLKMQLALKQMGQAASEPFDCGAAAAVLRFLALRLAREPGQYRLIGTRRLFSRPHQELCRVLQQLGCEVQLGEESLEIRSWGWKMSGDALHIRVQESSQFVSAVLLSSWDLPQPIFLQLGANMVSRAYFEMTCRQLERLGMKIEPWAEGLRVGGRQKVQVSSYTVEPDMSSAFAVAAIAAVSGRATLLQFPDDPIQPDAIFIDLLREMGVPCRRDGDQLRVDRPIVLQPLRVNLRNSPDLFPILAVLCALAEGESELRGAEHLKLKESDRIGNTVELLRLIGRECVTLPDGIRIKGSRMVDTEMPVRRFDPDQDHRMAMAAAILLKAGFPIEIVDREVVAKSFPEFWQVAAL